MKTSKQQISLFTEEKSTSLPEDFHANHIHSQENEKVKKMIATSGRKCLEQYEKFSRNGLWGKTFSELLIGMEGWYSTKCKLTWKMKGTRYNRLFFQLQVSTLRTEETEFGLLLLKTPGAMDAQMENMESRGTSGTSGNLAQEAKNGILNIRLENMMLPSPVSSDATTGAIIGKNDQFRSTSGLPRKLNQNGKDGSVGLGRLVQMLTTPTAMDSTGATANMKSTQVKEGSMHSMTLSRYVLLPTPKQQNCQTPGIHGQGGMGLQEWAMLNMLPTPTSNCQKGGAIRTDPKRQSDTLAHHFAETPGKTSQLNPLFVAEMMGFPTNWTILPFQNGETNQ